MIHVVVTGSTRGIGLGLAREFLKQGCGVFINGRTDTSVRAAQVELATKYGEERIAGCAGDVSAIDDVRAIWNNAVAAFGSVDLWVNNAGIGQKWARLVDLEQGEIESILAINILGTINGCRVAIEGMSATGGRIYNMEGYGSDGASGQLLTAYGTSKRAVHYLSRSLAKELKGSPVLIGTINPGMVVTDFLMTPMSHVPEEFERAKKVFNIIADRVETVSPYLARKMLANKRHGVRIAWISKAKIFIRFLTAPFSRRNLFESN